MASKIDIKNPKQIDLAAERLAELFLQQVRLQTKPKLSKKIKKKNGNKN